MFFWIAEYPLRELFIKGSAALQMAGTGMAEFPALQKWRSNLYDESNAAVLNCCTLSPCYAKKLLQFHHHIAVYEPSVQTRAYDFTLMVLVGTGCLRKYWGINDSKDVFSDSKVWSELLMCLYAWRPWIQMNALSNTPELGTGNCTPADEITVKKKKIQLEFPGRLLCANVFRY